MSTTTGPTDPGDPRPPDRGTAEFDAYARGYSAGMDNPLKRLLGRSADDFIAVKVRWLLADLRRRPLPATRPALLDCGCGAAVFLRLLHGAGFAAELHGCDISRGMLDEAARAWRDAAAPPLALVEGERLPYDADRFDLVVASAVLHHVPVPERAGLFREVCRVLKPGGRFYVFEHNPLNPVTRLVVARTPIDANAILLHASEMRRAMTAAGLERVRGRSLMYLPPRWRWGAWVDHVLGFLPFGGQCVVTGDRPGRVR